VPLVFYYVSYSYHIFIYYASNKNINTTTIIISNKDSITMHAKNKKGFWQNNYNEECKNNLGHSVVDWDFYESTCNHIHLQEIHSTLFYQSEFTEACEHVCIIFICGLPYIQTHVCTCTCTSIYTSLV